MKSKTILFTMIISVVLASGAYACALSSGPLPTFIPTIEPSPTVPNIEVLSPEGCELHLWHSFTHENEAALRDLAAKFEMDNPYGIRLRVEFHRPLCEEVLAAISAGSPPDIVIAPQEQIAEYALVDAIVPLGEYINDPQYGLNEVELADLWPIALESVSPLTRQSLGLYFDIQIIVMFYNRGWLRKLRFNAPPQSWDEFKEICSAAGDKRSGTWGCAYAADVSVLINWILGQGGTLIDPYTGQATLDSTEAIAALSLLKDLIEGGCAYCASERGAERTDFVTEKVLFTFGSTGDLRKYAEEIARTKKRNFEWDIAPVPHLASVPHVNAHSSLISILHTTPRQQLAAWLFLKWFLQPENDVQWALATGALPIHKSSQEALELRAYFEQNPQYKTACQLLAYAQLQPFIARWQDIQMLLFEAVQAVCLGQAGPKEALTVADTAADSLLTR